MLLAAARARASPLARARAIALYAVRLRMPPPPPLATPLVSLAPSHAAALASTAPLLQSAGSAPALADAASLDAEAVALVAVASSPVAEAALSGLDAGFPAWRPHAWLAWALMRAVSAAHDAGGLEWAGAIAATSVGIRAVTVPATLLSQRTSAWFAFHKDDIAAFTARIKASNEAEDRDATARTVHDYQAFLARNGLEIVSGMLAPVVSQAFVFISMFSALRWLITDAALVPGFLAPAPWLLTAPDPTFALPLLATAATAVSVAINPNIVGMPDRGLSAAGQKLVFAGMAVAFSSVTALFPAVGGGGCATSVSHGPAHG